MRNKSKSKNLFKTRVAVKDVPENRIMQSKLLAGDKKAKETAIQFVGTMLVEAWIEQKSK